MPARDGIWWRAFYTLKFHRPSQLLRRLDKKLFGKRRSEKFVRRFRQHACIVRPVAAEVFATLLEHRLSARSVAVRNSVEDLKAGSVQFLGNVVELGWPFQWSVVDDGSVDHLWRFHLNYHEFLLDLAFPGGVRNSATNGEQVWSIVINWIREFPIGRAATSDDAWHPFCIAKRLPVWMFLWHVLPPDASDQSEILQSVDAQSRFLESHLEYDPGGNHLLENLRALAFVAAFLQDDDGSNRLLSLVQGILEREIPKQILDHGEHFERTPSYHAVVLEILLDIRDATQQLRPALATLANEVAIRMAGFLGKIIHPDRSVPLFGDSTLGSGPAAEILVERAQPANRNLDSSFEFGATQVDNYWTWRTSADDFLVFDAAAAVENTLPAHAHCDLLGIEASVAGRRLFVDGGVFDYSDSEMRRYCRGTESHNLMMIDEQNQFDVWSRFRMGYRGNSSGLVAGNEGEFHWARATHNAYRNNGVPVVGRLIACREGGPWVCVDWATGRQRHALASRLRCHPQTEVRRVSACEFALILGGQELRLRYFHLHGSVEIEAGWYCPEFGKREPISVLTWRAEGTLPMSVAWLLSWAGQSDNYNAEISRTNLTLGRDGHADVVLRIG